MPETVSYHPELDFKMNILQLVKVQIVKGSTDMPQNQKPNTYSAPQQDEYCDEEENNFEEYYDEDENSSEEYYGEDENSFKEG